MKTLTSCFAGAAAVVLASLPVAAQGTAAHAGERVHTGDLNMASAAGRAAFDHRVEHAANRLCATERNLTVKTACQAGVHAEANEKAAASNIQFASRV